jgi:hypothetical protein
MTSKVTNIADPKGASWDLKTWGNADTWKLIRKSESPGGEWFTNTEAMAIPNVGVVIRVTTQQENNVAEALQFVPFSTIVEEYDTEGR